MAKVHAPRSSTCNHDGHCRNFDRKENTAMKCVFTLLLIVLLGWTITDTLGQRKAANEQTKQIEASKDATLIESPEGNLANSEGESIFVGRTGQTEGSTRRGLIAFDFAGAIPPRSRIVSVTLTMKSQKTARGGSSTVELHRVTRGWKEGPTSAGAPGTPAQPGDPTWIHTAYPAGRWAKPGGDYVKALSAKSATEGDVYTWSSTPKLVADVQAWVNSPKTNFGWILIGDESEPATARVFYSSESTDTTLRPQLTVIFRPPSR